MCALHDAAVDLKVGLDAVSFEHEAFKAWEAKIGAATGETRPT